MFRSLLRAWLGPPPIQDPVFGRLVLSRFRPNPANSSWKGTAHFAPLNAQIAVAVIANEQGPTEVQRTAYRDIESRWPELQKVAEAPLLAFHRDVLEDPLPEADLWTRYHLAAILLPPAIRQGEEWQLGFESTADPHHLYGVAFDGWEATGAVTPEG